MPPSCPSILACAVLGLALIARPCGGATGRAEQIASRFMSCDPAVVHAAVDAALSDPVTLREPYILFHAAVAERTMGNKEQAAFLYLAARLRMSRQAVVVSDEARQALGALVATISPLIFPDLMLDPELARRAAERVTAWDRATPDPFRDEARAKGAEFPAKLAAIDGSLARLPSDLLVELAKTEAFLKQYPGLSKFGSAHALLLAESAQQVAGWRNGRCAAGEVR